MIKLESNEMTKAIERASSIRPRVQVINANERTYSVTGSKSDAYTVRFLVVDGKRLAECSCKAGQSNQVCYHVAAAAQLNVIRQSMKQQAEAAAPAALPAPAPARVVRRTEYDRDGRHVNVTYCGNWAI